MPPNIEGACSAPGVMARTACCAVRAQCVRGMGGEGAFVGDATRQAGTERPYTGEYVDTHTEGVYQCRACGAELFRSNEKFDSHCGWPSFWAPLADGTVRYIHDRTLGMERVEVRCSNCDSHLGHVFAGEGYGTPTDQRYCINSVSLKLVPQEADGHGTAQS